MYIIEFLCVCFVDVRQVQLVLDGQQLEGQLQGAVHHVSNSAHTWREHERRHSQRGATHSTKSSVQQQRDTGHGRQYPRRFRRLFRYMMIIYLGRN